MSEQRRFTIHMDHIQDYQYQVHFDWEAAPDLLTDEPPPLGTKEHPNASRLLAAALGNCLSASLLHCIAREDIPETGMKTTVTCEITRNENKRLRVGKVDVHITLSDELGKSPRLQKCLEIFDDFCVVTAAVREGIPVTVQIANEAGEILAKD
ncbi:MAG: OsmC family protein [Gammaproteobacteria bacterium]|jgi:organic hydroperoxide reductase OsmC/OhrA